jgi:antitoxin component YwqK of YwqJK toxin-antitoxin module
MRYSLTILILIFFFSCKTEYRKVIDSYSYGKIKEEFVYPDKKDTSKYTILDYFKNGKISFQGTVENGKFVGAKLSYYDNGSLKQVDSIINTCDLDFCCCDGKVFKYYSNGKLDQTFENRNGVTNGLVTLYYSDSSGILDMIGTFKNGKSNGLSKGFYKSGKLHSIAMYKDDSLINIHYFKENGDTTNKY